MTTDSLSIAYSLLLPNGLAPLPVYARNKRAALKWGKWQAEGIPSAQLPMLFQSDDITVAAICGSASKNLVVIDNDTFAQFENMRALLNDPPTWITESARGGHIYARTRVPVRSIKNSPDFQILAQGCYALAPFARHPSGKEYRFLKKTDTIWELPSLTTIPNAQLEPIRVRPTGMPRKAWQILVGKSDNGTADKSAREYAAILSMVNVGFDFARIHAAFLKLADANSHFGRWMTSRGNASARDMLERMYRKALKFSAHDSPDRRTAKAMRLWLEDNPLTGRTGVYDQIAFAHVLRVALYAGSLVVAVSARDLAEEIGMSKEAASKALRRLKARDLLALEQEWVGNFANVYRIKPPQTVLQNLYTSTRNTNVRMCIGFANEGTDIPDEPIFYAETLASHDAFRYGALSKSAAHVWEHLCRAPMTQAELVTKTGRSASTVSRTLDALQHLKMIEPCDLRDGRFFVWQAQRNFDLNALAQYFETSGKSAAQKRAHEHQRELRRRELAD